MFPWIRGEAGNEGEEPRSPAAPRRKSAAKPFGAKRCSRGGAPPPSRAGRAMPFGVERSLGGEAAPSPEPAADPSGKAVLTGQGRTAGWLPDPRPRATFGWRNAEGRGDRQAGESQQSPSGPSGDSTVRLRSRAERQREALRGRPGSRGRPQGDRRLFGAGGRLEAKAGRAGGRCEPFGVCGGQAGGPPRRKTAPGRKVQRSREAERGRKAGPSRRAASRPRALQSLLVGPSTDRRRGNARRHLARVAAEHPEVMFQPSGRGRTVTGEAESRRPDPPEGASQPEGRVKPSRHRRPRVESGPSGPGRARRLGWSPQAAPR